ncbi:MAG: hypothetical protein IIB40_12505 [Candidatus Marinimicrobia bacterium]|nr:hypothetical protein [Candidatus Neomarinimicrobiota bacterium]
MKIYLPLICSMLLFVSGCGLLAPDDDSQDAYPRAYPILSQRELDSIISDFKSQNGKDICVTFTEYGTIGEMEACGPNGTLVQPDSEGSITLAKEFLVRNSLFTGVTDSNELVITRLRWMHSNNGLLEINFGPQYVSGLEIFNSGFRVYVNTIGISAIAGSWFTGVIIPDSDRISAKQAEQELVGYEITYGDMTGEPISFRVQKDMIVEGTEKYIVRYFREDRFELRVAWRVKIGFPGWWIFVDTTTGEVLMVYQTWVN